MEKMKLKLKKKIFQTPLFFVNFLFFFFLLILTQLNGNEIFEETTVDQFSSISEAELLNQTFYWGTYRPNLYFGIKNRAEKEEILTGLMWHSVSNLDASIEGQNRMMQTHYESIQINY